MNISPSRLFNRVAAPVLLVYVVPRTGAGSFGVKLNTSANATLLHGVVCESCSTKGGLAPPA